MDILKFKNFDDFFKLDELSKEEKIEIQLLCVILLHELNSQMSQFVEDSDRWYYAFINFFLKIGHLKELIEKYKE